MNIKILHTSYPLTSIQIWKVSLLYLQNYTSFSHGNLALVRSSKIILAIQDSANSVSVNTFLSREKCSECLLSTFTCSVELFLKLGTYLFI